jgi:hypothetical protein
LRILQIQACRVFAVFRCGLTGVAAEGSPSC